MRFFCPSCDQVTEDAGQLTAHLEAQHAGFVAWLSDRLGADPVPLGAAVWYWNQDQDPAADGWQPATVTGWGGKDGCPVYDVTLANGWVKWGWAWQVRPRGAGDLAPSERPGALRGELGPWP